MEEQLYKIINNLLISTNKIVTPRELNSSLKLREDLGFDSFNLAELTVYVEDEFGVDIFEDGIVNTIGEILLKLKKKNE